MNKIILDIKQAIESKGLNETKAAKMAGLNQNKVWRMLSGATKKIDMEAVQKLQQVLGMVSDPPETYYRPAVIHEGLSPDEAKLLDILRGNPEAREIVETAIQLSARKRKIHLGRMLEDLEEVEGEAKK